MRFKNGAIFLIVFIYLISFESIKSIEWEPKILANMTNRNDVIIDTNNFIDKTSESYKTILNYIQEIQDLRKFPVNIFFVEEISSSYKSSGFFTQRKDIDRFTNDLAWYLSNGRVESDKDTLIIVFSIADRQSRIRTGENVRAYLSDNRAENYLNDLKSKLRRSDYTGALLDLMYNINWRITKDTWFYDFMENLVYFIILIVFCGVCCYSFFEKKENPYARDSIAETKLEKIKRITEKNENKAKFVEENCIICLEEFTQEEKDSLLKNKDSKKENNNEIPPELLSLTKNNEDIIIEDAHETNHPIVNNNLIDLNYSKNNTENTSNNKANKIHDKSEAENKSILINFFIKLF